MDLTLIPGPLSLCATGRALPRASCRPYERKRQTAVSPRAGEKKPCERYTSSIDTVVTEWRKGPLHSVSYHPAGGAGRVGCRRRQKQLQSPPSGSAAAAPARSERWPSRLPQTRASRASCRRAQACRGDHEQSGCSQLLPPLPPPTRASTSARAAPTRQACSCRPLRGWRGAPAEGGGPVSAARQVS